MRTLRVLQRCGRQQALLHEPPHVAFRTGLRERHEFSRTYSLYVFLRHVGAAGRKGGLGVRKNVDG